MGRGRDGAGEESRGRRDSDGSGPSFAYTQTFVRLYPNDCAAIRKRLFDYTQIETCSWILALLNLGVYMLLASWSLQQFGVVALGPLVQQLAGRVESQSGITGKHAGGDIAVVPL